MRLVSLYFVVAITQAATAATDATTDAGDVSSDQFVRAKDAIKEQAKSRRDCCGFRFFFLVHRQQSLH